MSLCPNRPGYPKRYYKLSHADGRFCVTSLQADPESADQILGLYREVYADVEEISAERAQLWRDELDRLERLGELER